MKRPWVNFANIQRAAFTHADPKSSKKTVKLSSFIALLGSARVKTARKHVDEIDPRCQPYKAENTVQL